MPFLFQQTGLNGSPSDPQLYAQADAVIFQEAASCLPSTKFL